MEYNEHVQWNEKSNKAILSTALHADESLLSILLGAGSELPKRQICRWRNHSAIHKIPASNGSSIYIPIDPPFNERKLNYTSRNKWTNWRRLKQITRKSYVWRYLTVSQNKFPNTARINPFPRSRYSSRNSFSFNLGFHRFRTIGCHWNFSDWFFFDASRWGWDSVGLKLFNKTFSFFNGTENFLAIKSAFAGLDIRATGWKFSDCERENWKIWENNSISSRMERPIRTFSPSQQNFMWQ